MSKFYEFWSKYGKWFGFAFTALVVGLLIYLHVFATPVVPQLRQPSANTPDMWVCQEDPLEWVDEELFGKVKKFWDDHGHSIGGFKRVPCSSIKRCGLEDRRTVLCDPDNIVVSLRDQWFEEDHAGETLISFDKESGKTLWAAILLPSKILGPDNLPAVGDGGAAELSFLPSDAEALVVAHEVGHWFGYDHVVTRIAGPFISQPTGHLMHRSILKSGWGDEGFPTTK